MDNQRLRLVALSSGTTKEGKPWYRAIFKTNGPDGAPIVKEFWLSQEVGDQAKKNGLIEDVDVLVECGLDEFLRPGIVSIMPCFDREVI